MSDYEPVASRLARYLEGRKQRDPAYARGSDLDEQGPMPCGCYRVEVQDFGHDPTKCRLAVGRRPDRDEELLAVRLTRREWREIKAAVGEMVSGPQDVLWDRLDAMDLGTASDG